MNKTTESLLLSTRGLAALALIAAVSYFLLVEHREHLLVFLPYVILPGSLLQWPTIPTLIMFPIAVVVYMHFARREEQQALAEFDDEYRRYQRAVPAWWLIFPNNT